MRTVPLRRQQRDAELLERALSADPRSAAPADLPEHLAPVARTALELSRLGAAASAPPRQRTAPSPEFVASLRERLVQEASTRVPAPRLRSDAPSTTAPRRVVAPTGLGRALTAGAAAAVVGAVAAGAAAQDALPGDTLYGVKQVVADTRVRLAPDDQARGEVLLAIADERLDEVDRQVSAGDPVVAHVDESLRRAADALSEGQRRLVGAYRDQGDAEPLLTLVDYQAVTIRRAERLRDVVPNGSVSDVEAVLRLLRDGQVALQGPVRACGEPCAEVAQALTSSLADHAPARPPRPTGAVPATPGTDSTGSTGSTGGPATDVPGLPGVPLPDASVPGGRPPGGQPPAEGVPPLPLPPVQSVQPVPPAPSAPATPPAVVPPVATTVPVLPAPVPLPVTPTALLPTAASVPPLPPLP